MSKKNEERTILGPILIRKDQDWSFLRFSSTFFIIYTFEILNIVSQLSCEAKLKILSKNIEKCRRKSMKGPILVLS